MAESKTYFISSTSLDLAPYRQAVIDALRRRGNTDVIAMEEFNATQRNALQLCYDEIQRAGVMIGIYAYRYGYAPGPEIAYTDALGRTHHGDGETSITRWEYKWAMEQQIPVLIFMVDKTRPPDPPLPKDEDKSGWGEIRLDRFKTHLSSHHVCAFFAAPDELALQVLAAVDDLGNDPIDHSIPLPAKPFIGHHDLIQRLTDHLEREVGDFYLLYGRQSTCKSAILQRLAHHAQARDVGVLHADFRIPKHQRVGESMRLLGVRRLWQQLKTLEPAITERIYQEVQDTSAIPSLLKGLALAIQKTLAKRPLVLLIDNLHREPFMVDWLKQVAHPTRLIIACTWLESVSYPLPENPPRWKQYNVSPFSKRDAGLLVSDPPDLVFGERLLELSGGLPEEAHAVLGAWEFEGLVTLHDTFITVHRTPEDLPDVWAHRLDDSLETVYTRLSPDERPYGENIEENYDGLLDWLGVAALEGHTFSEATLCAMSEDEVAPEITRKLLHALASLPNPLVCPDSSEGQYNDDTRWRFTPRAMASLLLREASRPLLIEAAPRLIQYLRKTSGIKAYQYEGRLEDIRQRVTTLIEAEYRSEGLEGQALWQAVHQDATYIRITPGYAAREARIAELQMRLGLLEATGARAEDRWRLWRDLGHAMRDYRNRSETKTAYEAGYQLALEAHAESWHIAWLAYYVSSFADEEERLGWLERGWQVLPALQNIPFREPVLHTTLSRMPHEAKEVLGVLFYELGLYYSSREPHKALLYYEQALPISRAVGDHAGEAATLNNIGVTWADLGDKHKALDYYEQALSIRRAVGDRRGEAATLNNIGEVYRATGEPHKALEYYQQALPIRRALGERTGEAATLNNIGLVWNALGEKHKALNYYEQALPIFRAVGERTGEAATLNNIGGAWDGLGEKHRALEYYEHALLISRAVVIRPGEATSLNNIGMVYRVLGELRKALEYFEQALPIRRAVGDRAGEATTLSNIGAVWSDLDEPHKALEYFEQALPLCRAVGDRAGEASTLNNIGAVWDGLGESRKALEYFEQALPIRRAVGDRVGEAATLDQIGTVYSKMGRVEAALEHLNRALPIRHEVQDRAGEAATLYGIGWVYSKMGRVEAALEHLNHALPILQEVQDRAGEATTLFNMSFLVEDTPQAIEYVQRAHDLWVAIGSPNAQQHAAPRLRKLRGE